MGTGVPNSSPTKPCEQCSTVFRFKPAMAKRGHARFCSKACQNTWQSNTRLGDAHSYWKGDDVGYVALHSWVKRKLGKPKKCWECSDGDGSTRRYQWANLSHDYKRDLSDWARLCASCHKLYDNNKLKLTLQGK